MTDLSQPDLTATAAEHDRSVPRHVALVMDGNGR
ncbi:MAG: isoprenyl transferase, partial [Chitinophagaceae bacterium]|nr:isoprenyl transferase [Rubrivivax sp.]